LTLSHLGATVATFTALLLLYVIFLVWLSADDVASNHYALFRLWAIARNFLLLRMILDCVLGFVFDEALWQTFLNFFTFCDRQDDDEEDKERGEIPLGDDPTIQLPKKFAKQTTPDTVEETAIQEPQRIPAQKAATTTSATDGAAAAVECEVVSLPSIMNEENDGTAGEVTAAKITDSVQRFNKRRSRRSHLTKPAACSAVYIIDNLCAKKEPMAIDELWEKGKRLRKYFKSLDDLRDFLNELPHIFLFVGYGGTFQRREQRDRDLFEKLKDNLVGQVPVNFLKKRINVVDPEFLQDRYGSPGSRAIEKFLVDYGELFNITEQESTISAEKHKMVELKEVLVPRKIRQWSVEMQDD